LRHEEAIASSLYDILHVTRSHKRTKDVVTRRIFDSPNALSAPPGPLAAITRGILIQGEGRGRKKERRKTKWRAG